MSNMSEEEWQKMSPEERLEHQVKNCVFCKIIKKEIPSKKIYEDDDFFVILDINPCCLGHALVLTKKHIQIMPQLGTELNGKLGIVTKNVSEKLKKALGINSVSVFVANGAVAGQNAPHFMLHIIPRKEGDGAELSPKKIEANKKSVHAFRNKMISALGLAPVSDLNTNKKSSTNNAVSSEDKLKDVDGNANNKVDDEAKKLNNDDVESVVINNKELKDNNKELDNNKEDKALLKKIKDLFD